MKSAAQLVVVGSSNTDLVLPCPRLPRPGETLLGGELARYPGGKGANQAVAAARAGARVDFVGGRGDDDFGATAAAGLRAEGIGVRHFRVYPRAPSGVAVILLGGRERQNQIVVARSANDALTPAAIRAARALLARADAVVVQLEIPLPAVQEAARMAKAEGVPLILNPAPARALPVSLYRLVDTLVPNEHEARLLSGQRDPARAARALRRRGCRRVVVTLGARGALVSDEKGERTWPAVRVRPVDTVGAGDCFTAWLAVGLAEGLDLDAATHRALRAAALAVTRSGAQPGMPWRREVAP